MIVSGIISQINKGTGKVHISLNGIDTPLCGWNKGMWTDDIVIERDGYYLASGIGKNTKIPLNYLCKKCLLKYEGANNN